MMRTYLTIQINTDGVSFSELTNTLQNLGFKPLKGYYDFVYEWDDHASIKEILWFADKIHTALSGKKVYFRLETLEQ